MRAKSRQEESVGEGIRIIFPELEIESRLAGSYAERNRDFLIGRNKNLTVTSSETFISGGDNNRIFSIKDTAADKAFHQAVTVMRSVIGTITDIDCQRKGDGRSEFY